MEIGNIDVLLESITIASVCNKVLRKRFLKSDIIGLFHPGSYAGNINYSKKALIWLVCREQTDGCRIMHERNRREYRFVGTSKPECGRILCRDLDGVRIFRLFVARSHVLAVLRRQ